MCERGRAMMPVWWMPGQRDVWDVLAVLSGKSDLWVSCFFLWNGVSPSGVEIRGYISTARDGLPISMRLE